MMPRLPTALLLAGIALTAALLMPRVSLQRGMLDAVMVVDITQSMNTTDVMRGGERVSRLRAVKEVLAQTIPELPCGSRVGLGIFTEYRTLLLLTPVETCANRGELLEAIRHLNGQMAWAGDSEIAKGLYSALRILPDVPDVPALAFFTDGQESPPVNSLHRPQFTGTAGAVKGMIVGVGGFSPRPIPKFDPAGHPLGFWRADEVLQTDRYTAGRQGSVENESMGESAPDRAAGDPLAASLQRSPGGEHLSYLHEQYLELLAAETQLEYRRFAPGSLTALLREPSMTRPSRTSADLRWLAGCLALFILSWRYVR